uniref:Protein CNPPD1 n=1 Tax=Clastoptera arizonana TaxID=38151 RepID=A0A1B6DA34_9HEMI
MTVCSSAQRKKKRDPNKIKFKTVGDHDEFISRITKTLYYGKLPLTERFSLPVTELAAEIYSEVKCGRSLDRLHVDRAAEISHHACVSPCSLVLALLYLERLKSCNSEYVEKVASSELFLVSMMVASKFLNDDGEEDEVFNDEWAASSGLDVKEINRLEREFLDAINWEVFISSEKFWLRLQEMESELALRQGRQRGWFSYTELSQLIQAIEFVSFTQTLLAMSAVCLTSYAASVMAMVASAMLVNQLPSANDLVACTSTFVRPLIPFSTIPQHSTVQSTNSILSKRIIASINEYSIRNTTSNSICSLKSRFWDDIKFTWINDNEINNTNEFEHFATYTVGEMQISGDEIKGKETWLMTISNLIQAASKTKTPTIMFPVKIATH